MSELISEAYCVGNLTFTGTGDVTPGCHHPRNTLYQFMAIIYVPECHLFFCIPEGQRGRWIWYTCLGKTTVKANLLTQIVQKPYTA